MAENQIAKLTPRHEEIMSFIVANPTAKRGDVARIFGVTQAWLSVVTNSDAFQAKMQERMEDFHQRALAGIPEKLNDLAHTALDRLIDAAEIVDDTAELREMAKLALNRIGYGDQSARPAGGNNIQNNFYSVQADVLYQARQRIFDRQQPQTYENGEDPAHGRSQPDLLEAPASVSTEEF